MPTSISKYGPIGAVAGVMGYLCWPYLDDPAKPAPPKATRPAELTAELLAPPAAPDLHRDVFAGPADISAVAAAAAVKEPTTPVVSEQTAERQEESPTEPLVALPDTMVLSGTFIRGSHRVAVINGALYVAGDRIPPELPGGPEYLVAGVNLDRVVLDLNGQQAQLGYPDLPAAHRGVDEVPAAARPTRVSRQGGEVDQCQQPAASPRASLASPPLAAPRVPPALPADAEFPAAPGEGGHGQ